MMQAFSFDGAKEAFHRCVVPKITLATHPCLYTKNG